MSAAWAAHVSGSLGARRLAVDSGGRPWIISGTGQVFQRSSTSATSGTWNLRGTTSDCFTDIGVDGAGGGSTVWALGCTIDANGNFRIFNWNGSAWVQPDPGARGLQITVDGSGAPWVVTAARDIWRRPVATGVWAPVNGTAVDIGAGPAANATVGGVTTSIGYVYVTAPDQSIWAWNQQPADPQDKTGESRFANAFAPSALGAAVRVAVNFDGSPWVIAGDGSVWYQKH